MFSTVRDGIEVEALGVIKSYELRVINPPVINSNNQLNEAGAESRTDFH